MPNALPDGFWDEENKRLEAVLLPRFEQMAFAGMSYAAAKARIVFNPTLANQQAAAWARAHVDDLLAQLKVTNERVVGDILANWVETPGANMGDLLTSLRKWFGADRASRIAVDQVTKVFANGERLLYQTNGVGKWRWNTNRDEGTGPDGHGGVCEICQPLDGKVVTIGEPFGFTPAGDPIIQPGDAHIGDRCWVTPVVE